MTHLVPRPGADPLTLLESAARLGRCRYVELALFSGLGSLAGDATDPAVATYLAGAARAHAFRAGLLEELLPVSVGLPGVDASTTSPGEEVEEALAALLSAGEVTGDGVFGDEATEVLTALVAVVYPAMADGYEAHLAACSPASDGAVGRVLRRVRADLLAVSVEGALVAYPGDPGGDPNGRQAVVASLIEAAGGIFGPLRPGSGA